ncbi:hypothetical protein Syun_013518 [Stephania yunnanensis]|uniref:RNase H type-1 domain-containing protein n=1 Tax=Stephania yunnanensis TaxID=152371 RepID=A0AAP0JHK2_9MAGN
MGKVIPRNTHRHLVSLILRLMDLDWEIQVMHTHREGNRAADWLATYAAQHSIGTHILDLCPSALSGIIREDLSGVSFPRMCHM